MLKVSLLLRSYGATVEWLDALVRVAHESGSSRSQAGSGTRQQRGDHCKYPGTCPICRGSHPLCRQHKGSHKSVADNAQSKGARSGLWSQN